MPMTIFRHIRNSWPHFMFSKLFLKMKISLLFPMTIKIFIKSQIRINQKTEVFYNPNLQGQGEGIPSF